MLSERAEEILEALWIQKEENKNSLDLGVTRDEPAIEELVRLGFIRKELDHIHLLEKGKLHALGCVRRHRLAERLLTDVLDVKIKILDEMSCKFEHLLHKGLEDSVCTLLGHPKICPHGKPIPPGKCCSEKKEKKLFKLVSPLSELEIKEKGSIAYLHTKDSAQMQRLLGIGLIPGLVVTLIQKIPSYVLQIGQSQFAIDKELAQSIYVRLMK